VSLDHATEAELSAREQEFGELAEIAEAARREGAAAKGTGNRARTQGHRSSANGGRRTKGSS